MDKITEIKNEIEKLKRELVAYSQKEIKNLCKDFFEKYPELCIGWAQYTPYFNDGEPCYFSRGDISISFDTEIIGKIALENKGSEVYKKYSNGNGKIYEDYYETNMVYENLKHDIVKDANDIKHKLSRLLDDDLSQNLYGDHVFVKLNKYGAVVDEYDHD